MGSGFKDFAAGDILTANDVDGYLMRQSVMTFADAAARDSALSGVLDEGMVAYLEDTNRTTYYTGSAWADITGLGGGSAVRALGTFVSGDVLQADELNKLNNVTALYDGGNQAVANATPTAVTFGSGTEIADVSGWHSTSTNTERITPNVPGIYLVVASNQLFYAGAVIAYECAIFKNTGQVVGSLSDGGFYPGATAAIIIDMNGTTDYVYSSVYHTAGVTTNAFRRSFSCTLLRKT